MEKRIYYPLGFNTFQWILAIFLTLLIVGLSILAWDPWARAAQHRDVQRASDVEYLSRTLQTYHKTHTTWPENIQHLPLKKIFMIVSGVKNRGCAQMNTLCGSPVTDDTHCADFSFLSTGDNALPLPTAPSKKKNTWDEGMNDDSHGTGYTVERRAPNVLVIRACEAETSKEIEVIVE